MFYAPRHVQPFARPARGGVDIPGKFGENHKLWRIACGCQAEHFDLYKSALPRVVARCRKCARDVVLYDIREYPAATVIPADDTLRLEGDAAVEGAAVYAMYEYPELDEGEPFNPDDITWCQVFAKSNASGEVIVVLDDETA